MKPPTAIPIPAPRQPLLPPALRPGDQVRLVSPASWFDPEKLQSGIAALTRLGYHVRPAANAFAHFGQYTAGSPAQRLDDLHAAFADPEVRAIVCTRGGYGSAELLSGIDLDLVRRNPKILIGCSDITSLALWLHDATGLVVFHGPMAAGDFARDHGVDLASWNAALAARQPWSLDAESGLRVLRPGTAHGRLYGGCLSMLVASLGTPFAVDPGDSILFLEDIGVKPYQMERMLLQLRLAGKLDRVRGIIFGPMLDCVQPGAPAHLLEDMLLRVLEDFSGPVAIGLRSGHVPQRNLTLPIGVTAHLRLSGAPQLHFPGPSVAGEDPA